MAKRIFRSGVLFLIPCLLVDPLLSEAVHPSPTSLQNSLQSPVLAVQALSTFPIAFLRWRMRLHHALTYVKLGQTLQVFKAREAALPGVFAPFVIVGFPVRHELFNFLASGVSASIVMCALVAASAISVVQWSALDGALKNRRVPIATLSSLSASAMALIGLYFYLGWTGKAFPSSLAPVNLGDAFLRGWRQLWTLVAAVSSAYLFGWRIHEARHHRKIEPMSDLAEVRAITVRVILLAGVAALVFSCHLGAVLSKDLRLQARWGTHIDAGLSLAGGLFAARNLRRLTNFLQRPFGRRRPRRRAQSRSNYWRLPVTSG